MTEAAHDPEIDAVLTPEARSWIGRVTKLMTIPEEVAASDLRRYLDATGDTNPLFTSDEAARAAGYRARILPPMMIIDLSWRLHAMEEGRFWVNIPLPPVYSDLRNGGQEIEWFAPMYLGDRLSIRHRIVDIVVKRGRRGIGAYIDRETEYFNQHGTLIARVIATAVRLPRASVEDR